MDLCFCQGFSTKMSTSKGLIPQVHCRPIGGGGGFFPVSWRRRPSDKKTESDRARKQSEHWKEQRIIWLLYIIVIFCIYIYEWRTKLLNYSSQWAWPKWVAPYWLWRFDAMWKNRVSASGWTPIGCEGFHTNLNIPSPLPTTLVFRWFCWLLIYIYIYITLLYISSVYF